MAVGAELATVLSHRTWDDPTKRDLLEHPLPVRVEAGAVDGVLFDRVVHWCRVRAVLVGRQVEGLFDLDSDTGENHNLLADRLADTSRLRGLLSAWEKEVTPVR